MAVVFKCTTELLLLSPPSGPFLQPLTSRATVKNSLWRQRRYCSGPQPEAGLWGRHRQCNLHLPLSPYLNSFWHISSLPYKSVLHLAGSRGESQTHLAKVWHKQGLLGDAWPRQLPLLVSATWPSSWILRHLSCFLFSVVSPHDHPLCHKSERSQVLFQCSYCQHSRSCLHLALGWGLLEKSDLGTTSRSGTRQKQESPVPPQTPHLLFASPSSKLR